MPTILDGEEYLTIDEACSYLGGISRETLRRRTKEAGIKKYSKGVTRRVYYRKVDIDRLNRLRPIDDEEGT